MLNQELHWHATQNMFKSKYVLFTEDGVWAEWGLWNSCPVTCGEGVQFRRKKCPYISTGQLCIGKHLVNKSCNIIPCQCTYVCMCLFNLFICKWSIIYIYLGPYCLLRYNMLPVLYIILWFRITFINSYS